MFKKIRKSLLASVLGVLALIGMAPMAHATGSSVDYITPMTTNLTQIQTDMVTFLPAVMGVALVIWGTRYLVKLFKGSAK